MLFRFSNLFVCVAYPANLNCNRPCSGARAFCSRRWGAPPNPIQPPNFTLNHTRAELFISQMNVVRYYYFYGPMSGTFGQRETSRCYYESADELFDTFILVHTFYMRASVTKYVWEQTSSQIASVPRSRI